MQKRRRVRDMCNGLLKDGKLPVTSMNAGQFLQLVIGPIGRTLWNINILTVFETLVFLFLFRWLMT